jgi:DnaJ-class molecular chaperone
METEDEKTRVKCVRCHGKGRFEGVYGRTVCGDCDGSGFVSKEKRKIQLKKNRDLMKQFK